MSKSDVAHVRREGLGHGRDKQTTLDRARYLTQAVNTAGHRRTMAVAGDPLFNGETATAPNDTDETSTWRQVRTYQILKLKIAILHFAVKVRQ